MINPPTTLRPEPRPLLKCEKCRHVRLLMHPGGPERDRWRSTMGANRLQVVDGSGCEFFEREPGVEG